MSERKYAFIGEYREGLALAREDGAPGRVGFVNEAGETVIQPEFYDRVTVDGRPRFVHFPFFSQGLVALMDAGGSFGYIDRDGRTAIPFCYEDARPFSHGMAAVKRDGKYRFINKAGQELSPLGYEWAGEAQTLAPVMRDGRLGFVNTRGEQVIPFVIDGGVLFPNGETTQ